MAAEVSVVNYCNVRVLQKYHGKHHGQANGADSCSFGGMQLALQVVQMPSFGVQQQAQPPRPTSSPETGFASRAAHIILQAARNAFDVGLQSNKHKTQIRFRLGNKQGICSETFGSARGSSAEATGKALCWHVAVYIIDRRRRRQF